MPRFSVAGTVARYKPLGEALWQLRRRAGVSQRELAQRVGLDHTLISKFENGHRRPPADRVLAICEALGVPGETLLGLIGEVSPGRRRQLRPAAKVIADVERWDEPHP